MAAPQRVLIYRLGSLGDTVVALPAFHLIARVFPDAQRRLLTNFPVASKAPPAAAILESTGAVHGYFRYGAGTRSLGELLRLWWQIARWRPDVLVYLGSARGVASARRDARFFRLCGIRRIVGLPLTDAMQRNLPTAGGNLEFEAERLARNLRELGEAQLEDPASWDLHLTSAEKAAAHDALAASAGLPILAVSVGTKVQSKDWGAANWRALLGRLAEICPGHALALLGAAEESAASEAAAEGWRHHSLTPDAAPVINLCGRLTPRESAAAFAEARLFLGHDSGPMHLAAAVGTPCIAIFAARNIPRVWFPYGSAHRVLYHTVECAGCGLETCIVERRKCLMSITVDEVVAEVQAVLAVHPNPLASMVR